MNDFGIYKILEFIKVKIASLFCTQKCPYCQEKTSCDPIEFVKERNMVKCSHCQRYLETVKNNR
ncbi:hypothetical protein [uncultured Ilyobacter sp.]|uniref:hypothetical protein n=1 Tax=uncultured Ilyobacter sp. TaxID=544433 RepID=UPI0029C908C8|nr:hypothetical protein [uncultured Ilyobacter sp.]